MIISSHHFILSMLTINIQLLKKRTFSLNHIDTKIIVHDAREKF
jgi:hypothetical protein